MITTIRTLRRLAQQQPPEKQEGQGLVEYALMLLFVALAVVGTLGIFGTSLMDCYNQINGLLPF